MMERERWSPAQEHVWEIVGLTSFANMVDGQTGEVFLREGQPFTAESIERMLAMPRWEYTGNNIYWYVSVT